eukprot:Opistho-1_new@93116
MYTGHSAPQFAQPTVEGLLNVAVVGSPLSAEGAAAQPAVEVPQNVAVVGSPLSAEGAAGGEQEAAGSPAGAVAALGDERRVSEGGPEHVADAGAVPMEGVDGAGEGAACVQSDVAEAPAAEEAADGDGPIAMDIDP